ncbi:FtsX-like permease family protein [Desulfitobacterium hafniense]|uniref:FtsX-like permease family protein n=1 Tax=Desulfitobacterium hafniense TaxID=49338 RepID=UPI001FA739A8|nr:ABC transporter permease [Desulfitobacterium hafniense]
MIRTFCWVTPICSTINTIVKAVPSAKALSLLPALRKDLKPGGRLYGSWASYQSGTSAQTMNRQPDGSLATALYGLEEFPFSRLKLVDGELDREKLAGGDYILECVQADDQGKVETGRFNHQVGDKITLNYGGTKREMTVLGHVVANPQTNTDGSWRGSAFFLPAIIGLIGVLNFVNAVLTGSLTRHRELAVLQSIGMIRRQLVGMLCSEGGCYAALTGISSILLSVGFSLLILRPLSEQIWFLSYRFVFWPLLIILSLLFVLGAPFPI